MQAPTQLPLMQKQQAMRIVAVVLGLLAIGLVVFAYAGTLPCLSWRLRGSAALRKLPPTTCQDDVMNQAYLEAGWLVRGSARHGRSNLPEA